jgi:ribosomal protein S16
MDRTELDTLLNNNKSYTNAREISILTKYLPIMTEEEKMMLKQKKMKNKMRRETIYVKMDRTELDTLLNNNKSYTNAREISILTKYLPIMTEEEKMILKQKKMKNKMRRETIY